MAGGRSTERRWGDVLQTLTLDGASNGMVTVSDTAGLHTKQTIQLSSATQPRRTYQVKRVLSSTALWVGPVNSDIDAKSDVSVYLVLDGAQLEAFEQQRPGIDYIFVLRQVYEEEPGMALRVMQVDQYGDPIGSGGVAADVNVAKWGGAATTLGQKDMAHSVPVVLPSDQMVLANPLITAPFDAIGAAYPAADTEVYSYFDGGLGGVLVGTVTVKYTDATKANVSSVVRT